MSNLETDEEIEDDPDPTVDDPPRPVVTYGLIGVFAAVFIVMAVMSRGNVAAVSEKFGWKDNALIQAGQWQRLITPIFLHGGLTHLLVNCYSLYVFGGSMERIYGARKFFLICMVAGIAGNIVSFYHSPLPSVGASGAISGLVGAGLVFPLRFRARIREEARKQILRQLLFVLVLNGAIGYSLNGLIDNWAHMGGLVGGALVALILIPDVLETLPRRRGEDLLLSLGCVAMAALILVAAGRQAMWARRGPAQDLVAYESNSPGLFWTLALPRDWKPAVRPATFAFDWQGPKGERLEVTDSVRNGQLIGWAQAMSRQAPPLGHLGGLAFWRWHPSAPQQGIDADVYLIAAPDRVICLTFAYPAAQSAEMQRLTPLILSTVRFRPSPGASTVSKAP